MKLISEKKALERLARIKDDLTSDVRIYERRAKSCSTCETPGICCLDEHFVNVHISKLEAAAITNALGRLPAAKRHETRARIDAAIEKYGLTTAGDTFARTFACPLFEKGTGCLVHNDGKPVPCIVHACYDREEDLPPRELQTRAEQTIDGLHRLTYGRRLPLLPLPLALQGALLTPAKDVTEHKS
jgi:hypothetical protein